MTVRRIRRIPRERRHTLHFLGEVGHTPAVFLDTEVDMGRVLEHRGRERAAGTRIALVSYVVHTAARALAEHPRANAAVAGHRPARVAEYDSVHVKLALDRHAGGERIVAGGLVPFADRAGLDEIQRRVDELKASDPDTSPEFSGIRALHRLPRPLGRLLFGAAVRRLRHRHEILGTLAVSSLGHRPVDGFHSVGGTSVTIGVGRVVQRPVVRDGEVTAAAVLRLNLSFDHRVLDGAEAADLLADIRDRLQHYGERERESVPPPPSPSPSPPTANGTGTRTHPRTDGRPAP